MNKTAREFGLWPKDYGRFANNQQLRAIEAIGEVVRDNNQRTELNPGACNG